MNLADQENAAARARCEQLQTLTGRWRTDSRAKPLLLPGVKETKIGEGTYANVYKGK